MSDLIRGSDWLSEVHQIPGQPFGSGAVEQRRIVGALARQAMLHPDAPFLTELVEGTLVNILSYSEAWHLVQRRAATLRHWGLGRGERVGLVGRNSTQFALGVLAVLESGGVAVLLSHADPPPRAAAHATFAQTRFLLHDDEYVATAQACAGLERAVTFAEFERLAASYDGAGDLPDPPRPTDGALILFTSGTTGASKAVVQSHYNLARHAWATAAHLGITPGVRLLCVLPLYHVNGLEFTIFAVLAGGAHTFISRGFDGLSFWTTLRKHDIHIASLVPNLLRMLAERPGLRGAEPRPLRYAVSAAAPLSIEVAERAWERLGLRIVQGYGLSEVTNFTCLMPVNLGDQQYRRWMLEGRRTSIGPALPGQEVAIVGDDGPVAESVEGEIMIRGHCVMSGYLHNPSATAEAFAGGWFHSGDLGYYMTGDDGRRYLHVTGRKREIAKRAGAMVSLLEIDEVLMAIPGVLDAGSASFANTWVDEEIAALVVRDAGSALDEESIARHCRAVLPFAATPKVIRFVDEIPRTASGKIRRGEIGARFDGLRERLFVERRPAAGRQ